MNGHLPEPPSPELEDLIEAYVGGRLDPGAATAFEIDLERDPELRAHVEMQRRIEASLGRLYADDELGDALPTSVASDPAPALRLAGSPGQAPPPDARGSWSGASPARALPIQRLKWYALAAAVVLGFGGVWSAYIHLTTPSFETFISPAELYATMEQRGFAPEFVCTTDPEFAATIADRFGQGLLVAATPAIQLVGWAYGNVYEGTMISPNTLVLLTKVDGEDVVVLIDRANADRSLPDPAPETGLGLFRRRIGDLVTYEITPRSAPAVVEKMYVP